ncbi:MAG TPA: CHAD domain-containing protein [Vicinamibacterales bacterium]|nr:CHAD domain-containing protein [Vicinamibacterales bacterium]
MNRRKPPVTSMLLARRAGALKRHLPVAMDGDARGVHQARVASRRLREAVPVLTTGIKGTKAKKARGKIRRLTRALGTVRELDVTLLIIDDLTARETLPRAALEEVRGHVVAEREKRRDVMLKRLSHVNIEKLDKRLLTMGEVLAQANGDAWRKALGSRLVKRAKALAAAMTDAGRMYSPEHLHKVRIAAKKLRYGMELAFDAGVKSAAAPLRTVKRVQETLGKLHDLQVLQSHVATVQAEPKAQMPLNAGLDIVARALEDQCRHLHARYVAGLSRLAAVVAETRSIVVPALVSRPRRQARAIKMSLKARPAGERAHEEPTAVAVGQQK